MQGRNVNLTTWWKLLWSYFVYRQVHSVRVALLILYYSFYFNMDTPNSVMTSLCPQYCLQLSLTISQTALCLAGIFYNFLFDSTSSTSDWGLKFRFYTYLQLTVTYYMRNFKLIIRNNLSMQMLVKRTNE